VVEYYEMNMFSYKTSPLYKIKIKSREEKMVSINQYYSRMCEDSLKQCAVTAYRQFVDRIQEQLHILFDQV
jgi:hypothetical protein